MGPPPTVSGSTATHGIGYESRPQVVANPSGEGSADTALLASGGARERLSEERALPPEVSLVAGSDTVGGGLTSDLDAEAPLGPDTVGGGPTTSDLSSSHLLVAAPLASEVSCHAYFRF